MLKHGLIYDKSYWEQFLDLTAIDFADFDELIYQSVVIKRNRSPTEKTFENH
jgi:3-dehydroquinate synthase